VADNFSLPFPEPLTEKYRPRTVDDFCGLAKPKAIAKKLIARPFASSWWFVGPSGTGKTSLALAIVEQLGAELHHIAARDCDLATVRETVAKCNYMPHNPQTWQSAPCHVLMVSEADRMTPAAQIAWLSYLDATEPIPNTIVIFTSNSVENMEVRLTSRFHPVEFSSYGISADVAALLAKVWDAETDNPTERPNFARLVKDAGNNVRAALMALECEIMVQG
jgi:replication factor C small subunit